MSSYLDKAGHILTDETITVTRGSCPECPFVRPKGIPAQVLPELIELNQQDHCGVPECILATIALYHGRDIPALTCCYGFFYLYWRDNLNLARAVEEHRIEYIDITGWETLEESKLKLLGPPYLTRTNIHYPIPFRALSEIYQEIENKETP